MESLFLVMPLHILGMILSRLDDMQFLGSAIFSHSLWYAAYQDDALGILKSILRNQIPANLMRYAIFAHDVRYGFFAHGVRRMPAKEEKVWDGLRSEFITAGYDTPDGTTCQESFLNELVNQPRAQTLAATLSKTHSVVQHFCRQFLSDTLPLAPKALGSFRSGSAAVSADEIFRVCRALYRFQIYSSHLGLREDGDHQDERATDVNPRWSDNLVGCVACEHFECFSPWVNEQLACMHDFLERKLSIGSFRNPLGSTHTYYCADNLGAFDDVAAHDVEWGALGVDWLARGVQNSHKQAYVSHARYPASP